jgi:type II secretory pathway component GspD/PulD (secretin)
MNGKSALLTVGYQLPFGDITGVDRDTETGLITFGTSIKRAILGLQLGITPHISKDGIVTLNIVPTITRLQGEAQVELPTTATTTQSIANPIINLQELSTTVRVREGNAIVLGGLISQMREANHQGLPWISQFPFFKFLFKHMDEKKENRELVIFITPHIRKTM